MIQTQVAIQGVCAWPNLVPLMDGTILAMIFNQPCHGRWEGDVDCWASTDQGQSWNFRSRVAAHAPGTNRMNVAAGRAVNGDLLVLASGWDGRGPAGTDPVKPGGESHVLPAWICRSSDQGRSWSTIGELPAIEGAVGIPFGKIEPAADSSLRATAYSKAAWMLKGTSDGARWTVLAKIGDHINETDILPLAPNRWLAASRGGKVQDLTLRLSEDDGRSWRLHGPLSLPGQIPAHLLRVADGSIVATYGNRCPRNFGVDARISHDDGLTWSTPIRIANMEMSDGGYPATVALSDGRLLTAFYQQLSGLYHYEMKTAAWDPAAEDLRPRN